MTPTEARINVFSLVSYLKDPLAGFLDRLRQEMVPGCNVHAHVTVLPPRPLPVSGSAAWRQICGMAPGFPAFDVELTEIRVFPLSNVIYLGIGAGADSLREMHAVFNSGILEADEVFDYTPHITLAQDLDSAEIERLIEIARRRWADFPHQRSFRVETLTFVQNTEANHWVDLGRCQLGTGEMKLLEPMATR